jgi:hypothetical protein
MRPLALSAILGLGVFLALSSKEAPASGKKSGSSPSRPSGSGPSGPGVFFPPSNYKPWSPGNYRRKNGGRIVAVHIDFTFTFNSDVGKVRSIDPPTEYDEKGNIKKLTAEELKKLKGDDPAEKKMVGYKSDFSELQTGDIVQIALSVKKNTPAKSDKSGKDGDKSLVEDVKDKPDSPKWVVAGLLLGKVTRIENANTDAEPKMTVQVTTAQIVAPGRNAPGTRKQTINPEQAQATVILIGHRPVGPPKP